MIRTLSLPFAGLLLATLGCHTRPAAIGNGDADETTGTDTATTDDWGESAETGSETGDTDTGEPEPAAFCQSVEWPEDGRPVAVARVDTYSYELLYPNGTSTPLFLDAQDIPGDASVSSTVVGAGLYVATLLAWTWVEDGFQRHSQLSMLDANGEQLWRFDEPGIQIQLMRLGEDGTLAAQWYSDDSEDVVGLFFDETGELTILGDARPLAPRRPDGLIPAQNVPGDSPSAMGFIDDQGQSFQPNARQRVGNWYELIDGDFRFIAEDNGAIGVAVESPDEATFSPIPDLGVEVDQLSLWHPNNPRWMLFSAEDHTRWWRIDLDNADAEELDLEPPAGFEGFDCYAPVVVIDADGRVLRSVRDAGAGSIRRLDPEPDVWDRIGQPVTQIDQITAQLYGDTTIIYSAGAGTTFCPWQEWTPGGAQLEGTQVQLVPPIDVDSLVLTDYQNLSLHPNGTCAAMLDPEERFVMLDVLTGDITWLPLPGGYVSWF